MVINPTLQKLQLYSVLTIPVVAAIAFLSGCTPSPRYIRPASEQSQPQKNQSQPSDASPESEKLTYNPQPPTSETQTPSRTSQTFTGVASYYAHEFHGKRTANGETYNMYQLTAAHRTLPFNTQLKVTNVKTNQTIIVRINDRGPFEKGVDLDLSYKAAKNIGVVGPGRADVQMEILK